MNFQTHKTDTGTIILSKKEYNILIADKVQSEENYNNIIPVNDSSVISFISSTSDENEINKSRLNIFEKDFSARLISFILGEHFEYGYDNQADILVRDLMSKNKIVTKEWLNNIYNRNYGKSDIMIGIFRLIARFNPEDINPQGQTMATAALIHKDTEVQECAIRAFESWASIESLEVLKNLDIHQGWLKDYLDSVIKDIEVKYGIVS